MSLERLADLDADVLIFQQIVDVNTDSRDFVAALEANPLWRVDDARHAGRNVDDLLVEPVTRLDGWVAEWIGRAFHGALFEWLANVDSSIDREPHEQGAAAEGRLETVIWNGHRVHVPPLDLQLAVAMRRGLEHRAAKIRAAMGA